MVADELISFLSSANFVWDLDVICCDGDRYYAFINEIHFRHFLVFFINELVIDILSLEPSRFHAFSKFCHEKAIVFHCGSHSWFKEAIMLVEDILE